MNPLFEFTADKATSTIYITREFEADLDLVWQAFTDAEILDQWFGPKPWRVQTKEMDFREGGRWIYSMVSPEKVAGYSLVEFVEIKPKTSFITRNSFCDEHGNPVNIGMTSSLTTNAFEAGAEKTTVRIIKQMASLAELEQFIAMGFKEGMAAVLGNLDALLQTLSSPKQSQ